MPEPRVSVRKVVRNPMSPRAGTSNSMRTQSPDRLVMEVMMPLRLAMSWVTAPWCSAGVSMTMWSKGSYTWPSTVWVTTWGLPTVNSNPSRRMVSTRTDRAISPRPCTSHASGRSVGSTRMDTLPMSSWSRRALTRRAVSLSPPPLPARGEVFTPIVMEMAGSSTVMRGRATGFSTSARVSPIMMLSMPEIAAMSPATIASEVDSRSTPTVRSSSAIFTFLMCWLPSSS